MVNLSRVSRSHRLSPFSCIGGEFPHFQRSMRAMARSMHELAQRFAGFAIVPAEATPLTNPHRNLPRQFAASLLLILLGLSGLRSARSQATPPSRYSATPDTAVHITLGQAVYPLYGPWKFRVGDSPLDPATQKPRWAEPGFDDSGWETVDLTPKEGSIDPISGLSGYVPGWTAKGHPGVWGMRGIASA